MISLLKHNLVAGWRNVMKYRVQNTVSVLCLAVGAILFAISLYFANIIWENGLKNNVENIIGIHNNRLNLHLWCDTLNSNMASMDIQQMNTLSNLPSVKSVCYYQGVPCSVNYPNGKQICGTIGAFISSDWLKNNNYRSAITGEKIGELKPGTIVAIRERKNWYSTDESNQIGGKVTYYGDSIKGKVSDVVYSTTYSIRQGTRVFIVAPYTKPNPYLYPDPSFYAPFPEPQSVVLKDGYTPEQFKKQFEKAIPTLKVQLRSDRDWILPTLLFLLLLFGSTVLVIGMSGYLKMQLQLFSLRSREMALRRCNGAKPKQVFMLLCSEIFIIFVFIVIVALCTSVALSAYIMPKLMSFNQQISDCIDLPTMYHTVIWVILATFLLAICIAWISVKKMLHNPLSTSINRSSRHPGWNNTMQTVQYLATTILFTLIGAILWIMGENTHFFNLSDNVRDYKKTGFMYYSATNPNLQATKLPSVEKCGWLYKEYDDHSKDFIKVAMATDVERYNDDGTYNYSYCVLDAEACNLLKMKIQRECGENSWDFTPIYVQASEVSYVKRQLGLKYELPNQEITTMRNGGKYILLGWTDFSDEKVTFNLGSNFYVIESKLTKVSDAGEYLPSNDLYFFFKPKNNNIDNLIKEASNKGYHITSLYDSNWCAQLRLFVFITSLLSILAIVSLIAIILTVYSSISLETRGKQKEVAIRKVNGAKTRDIIMLFSRNYIKTLGIAFAIILFIVLIFCITVCIINEHFFDVLRDCLKVVIPSILIITLTTILTLWQKIYKISHINPALLIKKE